MPLVKEVLGHERMKRSGEVPEYLTEYRTKMKRDKALKLMRKRDDD
jgi:hypothetical protein